MNALALLLFRGFGRRRDAAFVVMEFLVVMMILTILIVIIFGAIAGKHKPQNNQPTPIGSAHPRGMQAG